MPQNSLFRASRATTPGVQRQLLAFLAVGVLNTAFGYIVFTAFILMRFTITQSLVVSTVLGTLFNYFSMGRLVFSVRSLDRLPYFAAFYLLTFLFNLWSLRLLQAHGVATLLAQALLLPLMVALTFTVNKLLVFRRDPLKLPQ